MLLKEVKIEDIANVIGGGTPDSKNESYWNGDIPWITPYDLSNYSFKKIPHGERNISDLGLKKSSAKLLPKGTVLMTSRAPIGYLAIAETELCTNQGFQSLIVNEELADNNFIYYLLHIHRKGLIGISSGATFPEVSNSKVKKYKIKIPPLSTQRKIASILSAYDDLIENNLKRIKLLEEAARLIYEEWFVRFRIDNLQLTIDNETGLPEGWGKVKLKDCCLLQMGQSPESKFYNEEKIGLPFHQGVADYGTRFPITKMYSTSGSRFANKGDILISVRAPVGRLNIASEKMIIGRGLAAVRHKKEWNGFLYYQLQKIFFKEDIMGGGAIFNSVKKQDLENIKLIEGPPAIMMKFDEIVVPIDKQIELLTKENQILVEARDILLPRLMNGTISIDN